jgi:hypothetical protein
LWYHMIMRSHPYSLSYCFLAAAEICPTQCSIRSSRSVSRNSESDSNWEMEIIPWILMTSVAELDNPIPVDMEVESWNLQDNVMNMIVNVVIS